MATKSLFSQQSVSGLLLALSGLVFVVGGMLYTGRAIWKWEIGQTHRYLVIERSFVIAPLLVALLGFTLLERMLEADGDGILALSGWVILLVGSCVAVFAETYFISRGDLIYAPVVAFVILDFLAQALFGAALLRTHYLPAWMGWAVLLWNLGWLVIMPIARPKDMYYPWLHYVAPLLIGITLLVNG